MPKATKENSVPNGADAAEDTAEVTQSGAQENTPATEQAVDAAPPKSTSKQEKASASTPRAAEPVPVASATEPEPASEQEGPNFIAASAIESAAEDIGNLPDHLAFKISLDEYARLSGLNAFKKAYLTSSAGTYDRPFEVWEQIRQSVIGG